MQRTKKEKWNKRQVRVVTLSMLMVLLGTLSSQAQDTNRPQGAHRDLKGGTTDYVPLWLSATKLGISKVFQSTSGDIGVGTTSPAATLDVDGSINAATSFNLGGDVFALGNGSKGNAFDGFAGNSTTTGTDNTATGAGALEKNTSGTANNAYGQAAMVNNSSGSDNAAFGTNALFNLTTGGENTAVGVDALESSNGSELTCVGFDCSAGEEVKNGTAIGAHAMVTVSDAVVLGSVAGVNGAVATARVGIGTTEPTNLLTLGRGFGPSIADGWATYSSRRWKTNIETLHGALDKVERLRGVSYDLKANGQHEVGVIAEEVGTVVPELVTYEANGKDARGVDYSRLTALLIEATKEQQALIRHQQKLIRAQQGQISQLASQVQTIQVSLSSGRQAGVEVRTASVRTASRQ